MLLTIRCHRSFKCFLDAILSWSLRLSTWYINYIILSWILTSFELIKMADQRIAAALCLASTLALVMVSFVQGSSSYTYTSLKHFTCNGRILRIDLLCWSITYWRCILLYFYMSYSLYMWQFFCSCGGLSGVLYIPICDPIPFVENCILTVERT